MESGREKKVLLLSHLATGAILDGTNRVLATTALRLRPPWRAVVVCPGDGLLPPMLRRHGTRVLLADYLHCANMLFSFLAPEDFHARVAAFLDAPASGVARLVDLFEAERPALVHVFSLTNLAAAVAAHSLGLPVLWHLHEVLASGGARGAICALAARYATAFLAVSQAAAAPWREELPDFPLEVVYNGVGEGTGSGEEEKRDPSLGEKQEKEQRGERVVAFFGTIVPGKGVLDFCRMAARLHHWPGTRFWIIGNPAVDPAYTESVRQWQRAAGLTNLEWKGYYERPGQILPAVDLVVVPSLTAEALPNVIAEAMAFAKPVVAYRQGGIPEMVVDGETGLLVAPGDVEGLAQAVGSLLQKPNWRQTMGEAGRRRYEAFFTPEAYLQRLTTIYAQYL